MYKLHQWKWWKSKLENQLLKYNNKNSVVTNFESCDIVDDIHDCHGTTVHPLCDTPTLCDNMYMYTNAQGHH